MRQYAKQCAIFLKEEKLLSESAHDGCGFASIVSLLLKVMVVRRRIAVPTIEW